MHLLSALKTWLTIHAVRAAARVHRSVLMRRKLHLHRHSPPHKPVKKHQQWAIWIRDSDTQTQSGKPSLVSVNGESKVLSEFVCYFWICKVKHGKKQNKRTLRNEKCSVLKFISALMYEKGHLSSRDKLIKTAYLGFDSRL